MAAVLAFMEDPLVTWVRTFSAGDPVDFEELSDGIYLYDVLLQIDQRGLNCDVNRAAKDTNARIQNWHLLIHRLKSFYQDVLRQTIVMEIPNILGIVKESTKDGSLADLKRVLLLLLGCAVQCEQKEDYISKIRGLDVKTQEAMVVHIKEVTEDPRRVMPLDLPDWDKTHKSLSRTTRNVAQERDKHAENLIALTLERDYYQAEIEKKGPLTPPAHLEMYHLVKQINMMKNQLKAANQDIDDKTRIIGDLKDEVAENKATVTNLRTQNFDLQRKARSIQTYRDEADSLQELALKAEKYEKDIVRYKEKINELDFYKSRVEEVREDNAVLSEAKSKLEDQLATSNKRIESIMDELVSYQIQCEESQSDKDKLQRKMQELVDENAALEFERSNMKESLPGMKRMLSTASLTSSQLSLINGPYHKSISDELKDSLAPHMSKMEQENEELRQQLEENKQRLATTQREFDKSKAKLEQDYKRRVADMEQQTRELRNIKSKELTKEYEQRIMTLEKQQQEAKKRVSSEYKHRMTGLEQECNNLKQKVAQLQDNWGKDKEQRQLLEKKNKDLSEEKEQFKQTLKSLQEKSGDRIRQLQNCQPRASEIIEYDEREPSKDFSSELSSTYVEDLNRDNAKHFSDRPDGQVSPLIPRTPSQQSLASSRTSLVSSNETPICDIHVTPSVSSIGSVTSSNASVGRFVQMRNKPAARGVVTPQRRSVSSNGYSYTQPKDYHKSRDDRIYHHPSSTSTPMRPRSEVQPFSRSHPLRQSMPERLPERIVYVSPEKQKQKHSSEFLKPGSGLNREKSRSRESFTEKLGRFMNFNKSSSRTDNGYDKDSGHATSPESPNLDDSRDHRHSLSIYSTETIRTSTQYSTNTSTMKNNEKMRVFVDKIVDLQDRNQDLTIENSELKRRLATFIYVTDRLDKLEERNLLLEVENRKLKKIIDMLQGSGRNPHDNRIYHYYSNV